MLTRRIDLTVAVLLGGMAGAGCYNAPEVDAFLLKPRSPVSGQEYRVYPPDVISVRSLRVPEIGNITQMVRPDGKVNLPLVGEVYVAGRTPKEIEQELAKAAEEYYDQVDATVEVVQYNSQNFYVFGQVGRPGPLPWTGRDTLLDALAKTQLTPLAWPERILVVRGGEPKEGGQTTTQPSLLYGVTGVNPPGKDDPPKHVVVNLMAMVASGDMTHNIMLMPNDVIYVQANPFARTALAIEAIFFPIRAAANGLGDYRELVNQARWYNDGMPRDGAGRETLIVR